MNYIPIPITCCYYHHDRSDTKDNDICNINIHILLD